MICRWHRDGVNGGKIYFGSCSCMKDKSGEITPVILPQELPLFLFFVDLCVAQRPKQFYWHQTNRCPFTPLLRDNARKLLAAVLDI